MPLRLRRFIGIRFKLVFLSSFLLIIPWLGYRYILEMEEYLRRGQEQVVLGTARALATALNERPELFDESNYSPARRSDDLYVYPIYYPLALDDGNLLDWREYQRYEVTYDNRNYLRTPLNPARNYDKEDSLHFTAMVGEYNRSLYAYFHVVDDHPVYRSKDALSLIRSDFLHIAMLGPEGREIKHFIIAPHEPEFLYPFRVNADFSNPEYESRISGQWYATETGYEVELQIPLDMLGSKLGFAFYDVDDKDTRQVETVIATSNVNSAEGLGSLLRPTPEIDRIVDGMGESGSRIQVVDVTGRVLLTVGDIQSATGLMLTDEAPRKSSNKYWNAINQKLLQPLYYRVLTKPSNDFIDELYTGVTREGTHIDSALNGVPQTQFRTLTDTQTRILGAAHPILANGEVLGAVVVDQNMNGIRTFRNQALETLFNSMLAVMLAVVLGLFFFASRISRRIRLLRNQAEKIIDESGRVRNTIEPSTNADEIGDLSRSFSSILERLTQYTGYLENMSSRLSHELRTPVTVVRSSLENLGMVASNEDSAIYIERAEEGIRRLNTILTNMSEATRLEQMLQTSEKEKIDLVAVIRGCVEGYQMAYPDARFELDVSNRPIFIHGVPEYIAQLMDKLVANAVEFSFPDEKIRVLCHNVRDHAIIKVINHGPYLPSEMKGRLFDSMISVRPQEKQKQPHLGMGLHIARLIAEFHGGQIRADDLADTQGVAITVVLPLFFK
ncbi:MAG: proteobacterial dedicated sortase system histidine kinase [Gammaproteobacteria bacterium]|nr:proteobacterial dedicated sortase system histidine kinase [Pseudomonadales bacterium]MCP5347885.1 proteobacterial dedicated sortase system histidine kinase [Pseudomonadales bacterium]